MKNNSFFCPNQFWSFLKNNNSKSSCTAFILFIWYMIRNQVIRPIYFCCPLVYGLVLLGSYMYIVVVVVVKSSKGGSTKRATSTVELGQVATQ